MSDTPSAIHDIGRYRPTGLIANPFVTAQSAEDPAGTRLEIAAEANRLLAAIVEASRQDSPKPIRVDKTVEFPEYYPARAIAEVEHALLHDEFLNVLHAYVPFFTMRLGRVRATLLSLSERLAFRSFDLTLACYFRQVLASPDESLSTYGAVGPATISEFATLLESDPSQAVANLLGQMVDERRPEMTTTADTRLNRLPADVEEGEDAIEIDESVGEAPAAPTVFDAEKLEQAGEQGIDPALIDAPIEDADPWEPLRAYLIEYTRVHLSPVIARALKTYRLRGLDAMAYELRITKAPRKTLRALVRLATARFAKVAVIYDGFETWGTVPDDLKANIVGSLSEIRWAIDGHAVVVMMLDEGIAPELAEQFGGGTIVKWGFANLPALGTSDAEPRAELLEQWFDAARYPGAQGVADEIIGRLVDAANGDMEVLARVGHRAVEDAAERAVSIDGAAVEHARALP